MGSANSSGKEIQATRHDEQRINNDVEQKEFQSIGGAQPKRRGSGKTARARGEIETPVLSQADTARAEDAAIDASAASERLRSSPTPHSPRVSTRRNLDGDFGKVQDGSPLPESIRQERKHAADADADELQKELAALQLRDDSVLIASFNIGGVNKPGVSYAVLSDQHPSVWKSYTQGTLLDGVPEVKSSPVATQAKPARLPQRLVENLAAADIICVQEAGAAGVFAHTLRKKGRNQADTSLLTRVNRVREEKKIGDQPMKVESKQEEGGDRRTGSYLGVLYSPRFDCTVVDDVAASLEKAPNTPAGATEDDIPAHDIRRWFRRFDERRKAAVTVINERCLCCRMTDRNLGRSFLLVNIHFPTKKSMLRGAQVALDVAFGAVIHALELYAVQHGIPVFFCGDMNFLANQFSDESGLCLRNVFDDERYGDGCSSPLRFSSPRSPNSGADEDPANAAADTEERRCRVRSDKTKEGSIQKALDWAVVVSPSGSARAAAAFAYSMPQQHRSLERAFDQYYLRTTDEERVDVGQRNAFVATNASDHTPVMFEWSLV